MKFYPILFSTPMVTAILEGRKTMTRRIIKSRHESGLFQVSRRATDGQIVSIESLDWDEANCEKDIICPYGQPGDVLWVRESFYEVGNWINTYPEGEYDTWSGSNIYHYFTDGTPKVKGLNDWNIEPGTTREKFIPYSGGRFWRSRPSIHMPKSACRIFLEVIDVRVERLLDITDQDAIAEGVQHISNGIYKNYLFPDQGELLGGTPKHSFETLWQSINGTESWEANPFVWVISFKRISKPESFNPIK